MASELSRIARMTIKRLKLMPSKAAPGLPDLWDQPAAGE